jgi:peptide deformylase
MKLRLVNRDDPVLRKKCAKVYDIEQFRETVWEMDEIREKWEGLGLAAPQVGISRRFFVTEFGSYFNPLVLKQSESYATEDEGCLSLPGIMVPIPRPMCIEVSYQDEEGGLRMEALWHLSARVFLHELDHLDGRLIIDYA